MCWKEMNSQKTYDNMSNASWKCAVKYIAVTKQVGEINMGTDNFEDRSMLKVWRRYYYETYQYSTQTVEVDTEYSIRYAVQT